MIKPLAVLAAAFLTVSANADNYNWGNLNSSNSDSDSFNVPYYMQVTVFNPCFSNMYNGFYYPWVVNTGYCYYPFWYYYPPGNNNYYYYNPSFPTNPNSPQPVNNTVAINRPSVPFPLNRGNGRHLYTYSHSFNNNVFGTSARLNPSPTSGKPLGDPRFWEFKGVPYSSSNAMNVPTTGAFKNGNWGRSGNGRFGGFAGNAPSFGGGAAHFGGFGGNMGAMGGSMGGPQHFGSFGSGGGSRFAGMGGFRHR